MKRIHLALALFLSMYTASANADVLTWHFENSSFYLGGTINGVFLYDADTNQVTDVDFETTFGGGYEGAAYTQVYITPNIPVTSSAFPFYTGTLTQYSPFIIISMDSPLGDGPGTVSFNSYEYRCNDEDCGQFSEVRTGNGQITTNPGAAAAPTPEPPAIALLSSGAIGLIYPRLRRRWTRSQQRKR